MHCISTCSFKLWAVCGRLMSAGPHLNSLSKKLSRITVCCHLSSLPFDVSLRELLQQCPRLINTQACVASQTVFGKRGDSHCGCPHHFASCSTEQGATCGYANTGTAGVPGSCGGPCHKAGWGTANVVDTYWKVLCGNATYGRC